VGERRPGGIRAGAIWAGRSGRGQVRGAIRGSGRSGQARHARGRTITGVPLPLPSPLRRRRVLPAELVPARKAFERCAAHVDLAQRAMIRCVPSSPRSLALPVEVGAQTVRTALGDARAALPAWRHPALEEHWQRCAAAVDATLAGLDAATVTVRATTELEVALTAVQDLLDPLHAFVDAEEAFGRLRRRG